MYLFSLLFLMTSNASIPSQTYDHRYLIAHPMENSDRSDSMVLHVSHVYAKAFDLPVNLKDSKESLFNKIDKHLAGLEYMQNVKTKNYGFKIRFNRISNPQSQFQEDYICTIRGRNIDMQKVSYLPNEDASKIEFNERTAFPQKHIESYKAAYKSAYLISTLNIKCRDKKYDCKLKTDKRFSLKIPLGKIRFGNEYLDTRSEYEYLTQLCVSVW